MNPVMKEAVKKDILKCLDNGIVYIISDSSWVSPVQERWRWAYTYVNSNRMASVYRLQEAQCGNEKGLFSFTVHWPDVGTLSRTWILLFDGYSGYNQIPITPKDQEKTTFTCLFGTFTYKHMLFGLCNAPTTFQRWMLSIFLKWWKDSLRCSWTIFPSLIFLLRMPSPSQSGSRSMQRKESDIELGEGPLYGPIRHYFGSCNLQERDLGGQSKSAFDSTSPTS